MKLSVVVLNKNDIKDARLGNAEVSLHKEEDSERTGGERKERSSCTPLETEPVVRQGKR